jgi:hypothetical protein
MTTLPTITLQPGDQITIVAAPILVPPPVIVPPPVVAPPPVPPTSSTMPVGDLPHFHQVFTDDFVTLNLSRYVFYSDGWKDTTKHGTYNGSASCRAASGILTVGLNVDGVGPRSVAFIPQTPGGQNQLYGRYAVRFRAPITASGWKTAWLLWPSTDVWPQLGEIDFPEGTLTGTIGAFMHRWAATSGSDQDAYSTSAHYTDWHTAVIEWVPGRCEFFIDGVSIGKSTSRVPSGPMHWVIQSETDTGGTIPTAPASIEIDWLAVWSYVP